MAFSDPIAQLLTTIRNAKDAQHRYCEGAYSNQNLSIVKILHENGFILKYETEKEARKIIIFLKYTKGRKSIIHGLKRVSTPGVRKYVKNENIPSIFGGIGISIISTSKGVMDNKKARELNVGGELICSIW